MSSVPKAMDAVHSVGNDLRQTLLAVKASDTAETRLELKKLFDACKAAALPFNHQTSTIMARFKESFLGRVLASYHKYVLNRDAEVALQEMFRVLEAEDAVCAMEGAAPSPSIPGASPASVEPATPVPPGSALDVHSPGPVVAQGAKADAGPGPRRSCAPFLPTPSPPPLPSIRVSQQPPQSPPGGDFEDVKQRQAEVASPPSKKVTKKKRRPEETDGGSEGDAIAARASKPQKRLKATDKRNQLPCVNCDVAGIPCIKTESGSACFSCASSKRGCTVKTLSKKRKCTGGAPCGRDMAEDESERDGGTTPTSSGR
ncbi:hypothetical protein FPV67DRAFT_1445831 [Lyophyllum atratum]|nr:hypothetical protein FPV67DRAFT_1445831 [Lyophyllum atratum]